MSDIQTQIHERIGELESSYSHVLTGARSTIQINSPRALMQLGVESRLEELYALLGETYVSPLRGVE